MSWNGLYTFDEADEPLTLLPMAARRALDVAGVHLPLAGWQRLPVATRRSLVQLGAAEQVDAASVAALVASEEVRPVPAWTDPTPQEVPPSLQAALGPDQTISSPAWRGLHALDRYVLVTLAARGRSERLVRALGELRLMGRLR